MADQLYSEFIHASQLLLFIIAMYICSNILCVNICIQIISYYIVTVLTLTRRQQRLSSTVDKGQMVALDCSMIFNDQVFPSVSYTWRKEGTFTALSNMARYLITADSDFSYQCLAIASNLNGRYYVARGIIDITVIGTYLS